MSRDASFLRQKLNANRKVSNPDVDGPALTEDVQCPLCLPCKDSVCYQVVLLTLRALREGYRLRYVLALRTADSGAQLQSEGGDTVRFDNR